MQDFPANSQKAKTRPDPEPKKIERVTTAEATQRKRGLGRQFKETFIGGSARMAAEYMVTEVIVPAIQETLIDAFQGGIERLIRGESSRSRRGVPPAYTSVGRVNYQGMSNPAPTQASRVLSRQSRSRQDFRDLKIANRNEAQDVIDQMYEILSRFGVVTVHDLYEMTGVESSHVDYKWGWQRLNGSQVRRLRDGGYLLDLPEPQPLG